jgi:hypothetical protein
MDTVIKHTEQKSICTFTSINPVIININWLRQEVYSCLVILKTDSTCYFGCVSSFIPEIKVFSILLNHHKKSHNSISHMNMAKCIHTIYNIIILNFNHVRTYISNSYLHFYFTRLLMVTKWTIELEI